MKHIKKYAVYGMVYASEGMYTPDWFYRGTFYRCKVFIANTGDHHPDYEEVVGDWFIGWSEEYLEERYESIPERDELLDIKISEIHNEEKADIKQQQAKFDAKYISI